MHPNRQYKHLVQKPYLCGPCCLQMVLIRRGFGWIDQEEIAANLDKFGVTKKVSKIFSRKIQVVKERDAGIWLKDFGPSLNNFFKERRLPLKAEVYYISQVDDVEDFITKNLKDGNDIIANVRMEPILKKRKAYGHYLLIERIVKRKKVMVRVCDPYYYNKSSYDIELKFLIKAMSKKWDKRERGFLVIKDKT